MIYFDNAATSGKKPQTVIEAVKYALNYLSANPGRSGHDLSVKTADIVYITRSKIANFFGCEGAEKVIFTQNCTHSINCVLKGILKWGDHVVISNLEHNAVMRPLKKIGVNFSQAEVTENTDQTIENFKNSIRPNTKLVLVTGASNVTGIILPLEEIGKICKERGVRFAVDGAQIAGIIPINMQKMNIDYLCLAPHKGFYAPMGIGVLLWRKPLENTILEGGTGTDSIDFSQPTVMPEGFESGTINVPAIVGLSAGIDFVEKIGVDRIYEHEFLLLKTLYNGLEKNENIILYTKKPTFQKTAPVIPFNFKNCESYKLAKILNLNGIAVRAGLHCAPTAHKSINTLPHGAVRASFSVYNNKLEIEKLISVLGNKKIIEKLKNSY